MADCDPFIVGARIYPKYFERQSRMQKHIRLLSDLGPGFACTFAASFEIISIRLAAQALYYIHNKEISQFINKLKAIKPLA